MNVVYRHDRLIDFGCWFSTKEAIRILYHVIRLMLTLKASISKAKICVYITPILTRFECAAIIIIRSWTQRSYRHSILTQLLSEAIGTRGVPIFVIKYPNGNAVGGQTDASEHIFAIMSAVYCGTKDHARSLGSDAASLPDRSNYVYETQLCDLFEAYSSQQKGMEKKYRVKVIFHCR